MLAAVILDLIILAIIGVCALISAKHGFVRTFIELVGIVLVILFANFVSGPLADFTYDKSIEPVILRTVENTTNDGIKGSAQIDTSSLPEFARRFINESDLTKFENSVTDNINDGVQSAVAKASQNIIKPMVSGILSMVYAVVIFFILMFVVKILAKVINKLFSFQPLGKLNSILGGGIGVLKGIIFATIFCLIITVIIKLNQNGIWIFTEEALDKTLLLKLLTNILPF